MQVPTPIMKGRVRRKRRSFIPSSFSSSCSKPLPLIKVLYGNIREATLFSYTVTCQLLRIELTKFRGVNIKYIHNSQFPSADVLYIHKNCPTKNFCSSFSSIYILTLFYCRKKSVGEISPTLTGWNYGPALNVRLSI